jgi:acetyl esterase/lipase
MDLYLPPAPKADRLPAVVFVSGYADAALQAFTGSKLKEWQSYIGWGKLAALSGIAGVTYSAHQPAMDLGALLQYLHAHAAELGIDEKRIALWACSGNVPNALAALMQGSGYNFPCAVLCYGYTLDLDGHTAVADTAKTYGFANPAAGRTVDDFAAIPLLLVRAGRDQLPGLNRAMDEFAAKALARNLPLSLVNHAEAPHAFDLFHNSDTSREIIRQVLAFLQFHLKA